ncbi:MAG: MBL fold metallo-hydrolase [Phocaeicola plebeius]
MVLKVLGSSSQGNCYILENKNEALIIEAGVRFIEVKKALGFDIRKVSGCLITHQHNDHAKYVKAMVESGFPTLALEEVWTAKGVTGSRAYCIERGKGYRFGRFKVLPFDACHDVPCVGYLIDHPETGRIMFLTDSCMCEYVFPGLNQVMIECNYSDAKLVEAINAGRTLPSQRERLMTSHMELNTCKGFLCANDLTNVANIVLLHLSDNNSDEKNFVSEIERQTGKVVYAAHTGLEIELDRI